ncbi:MAG: AbrB/MazE/SpoVT family DNA-binding domain-containing protein [Rhizobiales bacterium]|nr:AbrB/MazE/SpoVT family DNA-binding domain-containing protein [Hyphomicrobiales bacterium]
MTVKGQVTIPKPVRDAAGITINSELEVTYQDGKVVIEKLKSGDAVARRRMREVDEWLAQVKGTGESGLSADEIMEMTRGPFDDVDPR